MSFKAQIRKTYPLGDKELDILLGCMETVSYRKNETIVEEGKKDYYLYFVEKGLLRSSVLRDGKHITIWLAAEGEVPFCSPKFSETVTSRMTISAIEDCTLRRIQREELGRLAGKSASFSRFYNQLSDTQLLAYESYMTEYYWLNKKEQYLLMMKQYPYLFRRVSQAQIASLLNITPQSLSRIRAHLD